MSGVETTTGEREPSIAEQSWVDGFLEGNRLVPQEGMGIAIFLAHAFLEHQGDGLETMMASCLSDEQRGQALTQPEGLDDYHEKFGIRRFSKDRTEQLDAEGQSHGRHIPNNRIDSLWDRSKGAALGALGECLLRFASDSVAKVSERYPGEPPNPTRTIVGAWNDIRGTEAEETIKVMLGICVSAMRSAEGQSLSDAYQECFRMGSDGTFITQEPTRSLEINRLMAEMKELMTNSVAKERPDIIEQDAMYTTNGFQVPYWLNM